MVGGWRVQVQPTNQHLLHVCTLYMASGIKPDSPRNFGQWMQACCGSFYSVSLFYFWFDFLYIRLTLNFTDLKACNEAAVKHLLSPALHGWLVLVVTSEKQSKPSSDK